MPFYDYRCTKEGCGHVQTVRAPEPLAGKDLDELYCEKCSSRMAYKFGKVNVLNGAEQPSEPQARSIDNKIIPLGNNRVLIGRKIGELPVKIPLPCGTLDAKFELYAGGRIERQSDLN